MLSARLFRELIDSVILGRPIRAFCGRSSIHIRHGSSSTRWKARAGRDSFSRDAKVQGLKSRAAFKLLEMNQKYRLFKPKQTVVDLGYAPGSWSQVAIDRVSPGGRVVGIDIIPAQPPKGVSTIQGNFLAPAIQAEVRAYVQDYDRGRPRQKGLLSSSSSSSSSSDKEVDELELGYLELERHANLETAAETEKAPAVEKSEKSKQDELNRSRRERDREAGRVVDVVISDMMMNTSGNSFKDHVGSMDLCMAALTFCFSTLRTGGHFVCKFYNGGDDKELEKRLKLLFEKVHREKPDASRKDSKEAFFVSLRRKDIADEAEVLKPIE